MSPESHSGLKLGPVAGEIPTWVQPDGSWDAGWPSSCGNQPRSCFYPTTRNLATAPSAQKTPSFGYQAVFHPRVISPAWVHVYSGLTCCEEPGYYLWLIIGIWLAGTTAGIRHHGAYTACSKPSPAPLSERVCL